MLLYENLTYQIRQAATEVHKQLGQRLLELAYRICLCHELSLMQIPFQTELPLPVAYMGVLLDCGYRIDVLVDDSVVVECKCLECTLPVHEAQLLTYMKLSGKRAGLLINFHTAMLKDGIIRRVL